MTDSTASSLESLMRVVREQARIGQENADRLMQEIVNVHHSCQKNAEKAELEIFSLRTEMHQEVEGVIRTVANVNQAVLGLRAETAASFNEVTQNLTRRIDYLDNEAQVVKGTVATFSGKVDHLSEQLTCHLARKHLTDLDVLEQSEMQNIKQQFHDVIDQRFQDHQEIQSALLKVREDEHQLMLSQYNKLSQQVYKNSQQDISATGGGGVKDMNQLSRLGQSQQQSSDNMIHMSPGARLLQSLKASSAQKEQQPIATVSPAPTVTVSPFFGTQPLGQPPDAKSQVNYGKNPPAHPIKGQPSTLPSRASIIKGVYTPTPSKSGGPDDQDPDDFDKKMYRPMHSRLFSSGYGGGRGGDGGDEGGGGFGSTFNSNYNDSGNARVSVILKDTLEKLGLSSLHPVKILKFVLKFELAARGRVPRQKMDAYLSESVKAQLVGHVLANVATFPPAAFICGDLDLCCEDGSLKDLLYHKMRPEDRMDFIAKLRLVEYVQVTSDSITMAEVEATRTYIVLYGKMYVALTYTFTQAQLAKVHPPWHEKGIIDLLMSTVAPSIKNIYHDQLRKDERNAIRDISTLTEVVYGLCSSLETFDAQRRSLARIQAIPTEFLKPTARQDERSGAGQSLILKREQNTGQTQRTQQHSTYRPSLPANRFQGNHFRMVNVASDAMEQDEEPEAEHETEELEATRDGSVTNDIYSHIHDFSGDFEDDEQLEEAVDSAEGHSLRMMGGNSKPRSDVTLPCFAAAFNPQGCPLGNKCLKSHDKTALEKAARDRYQDLLRSPYFIRPKDDKPDARLKGSVEVSGDRQARTPYHSDKTLGGGPSSR